ncbi:MAG: transcription elongation factor GreA [bacterium]
MYITREGLQKIDEELSFLKNVKRREIADRIQQAKELGDLSENAEYVEAKNEQAFIEGRILELENVHRNAEVIEETHGGDIVRVGSTILFEYDGQTGEYLIVGSSEADPSHGRISNESPLGKAFIGRSVGESVEITTPRGTILYTIKKVK